MSPPVDIQVEAVPNCPSCNEAGEPLYSGLRDHTFGTPGEWACSRCTKCGAIWLNPRPKVVDIGEVYRQYYTHGVYTEGQGFRSHLGQSHVVGRMVEAYLASANRVKRHVLASTMGYGEQSIGTGGLLLGHLLALIPGLRQTAWISVLGLPAAERGSLLDVGCGNGVFLSRMKALGWAATGVEIDEKAARLARERFGLEVRTGALEEVGFPDDTFDAVSLSHVIEHVYDPVALVQECRRILRPGGRLIILTPNTRSLGHHIFRSAWRGLEPPRHIQMFNRTTLTAAVRRAGLRVTVCRTVNRMMQGIWDASRLIQRANAGTAQKNSRFDYVASYVMGVIEGLLGVITRDAGEELVIVAIKP